MDIIQCTSQYLKRDKNKSGPKKEDWKGLKQKDAKILKSALNKCCAYAVIDRLEASETRPLKVVQRINNNKTRAEFEGILVNIDKF